MENGADSQLGLDDKLAIGLNVTTDEEGNGMDMNFCVCGVPVNDDGSSTYTTPTTFNNDGDVHVTHGRWYRLTVKSIDAPSLRSPRIPVNGEPTGTVSSATAEKTFRVVNPFKLDFPAMEWPNVSRC